MKLLLIAMCVVGAAGLQRASESAQLSQMDSLVGQLRAKLTRAEAAEAPAGRHASETVEIKALLKNVEKKIVNEMEEIKAKHDEEEKSIIARFEKDVAESTAKVAQKKSLFDDATKLKSAAMKELKDTERKLYSAQGELSMAESEKQVADKKAAKDKDVDIKSNRKNRDEGIGLISNEQGLIQSIQSLLEQLNGGKPVPLGTAAPGNSTSL